MSVLCSVNFSFRQNQPSKYEILTVKFLGAGEKVEISNLIGLFCLKDKLLGQKTDTADSSTNTEGLWKVLAKSESWFPIQPTPKWSSFLEQARRSKFQISSVGFV